MQRKGVREVRSGVGLLLCRLRNVIKVLCRESVVLQNVLLRALALVLAHLTDQRHDRV